MLPAVIGKTVARNALLLQKASPQVLLGVGIVGMVGSTVLACRATLKMESILDETKERLELAKKTNEEHPDEEYNENDKQRDISLIYVKTGVKVVRVYAPAVIIGGLSIYALTTSNNILMKRNIALTAAYGALAKGFDEYRARVVDKYGEDQDRDFRYGSQQVELVDPVTNKKKIVTRVGPGEPSIYARFFDPLSQSWSKDPEVNLFFLHSQQNYVNDLLHSRGHVFLNEVYDILGIPRSKEGAVVGWVRNQDGTGDNYINFGIFEGQSQVARDFVNGREGALLLDFNVDGVIYDRI